MKFMLSITLIFLIAPNSSCQDLKKDATYEVLSYIVDEMVFPIPPPPPPGIKAGTSDAVMSKRVLDSLNELPYNVTISPIFEPLDMTDIPGDLYENCITYLDSNKNDDLMYIEPFSTKKGNGVIAYDSANILENKEYKNFTFLFKFSKIYFNDDYTRATLAVGISTSELAGHGMIYCLEKGDNGWIQIFAKKTEVW